MAAKVLKIDVVIDEHGNAQRALTNLEGGVKKLETAAPAAGTAVQSLDQKLKAWDAQMAELERSLGGVGAATDAGTASMFEMSTGIGALLVVAGAAGTAIYALGSYVKDASEYYIEQSGVLEINRQALDDLAKSWDLVKYAIGEVIVGGDGDYRTWIGHVNVGLLEMGTHLAAAVEFYRELINLAKDIPTFGPSLNPMDPGDTPGIDTTERNPDGSLTPYGRMMEQKRKSPKGEDHWGGYSGSAAEASTNAEIARSKHEQLELEREQKREAAERLKLLNEQVKLEQDLVDALAKSKEQYDNEIAAAERLNTIRQKGLDLTLKDNFMRASMTKDDYQKYEIDEKANRQIAGIDPRADNAAELARRYTAEKQLALIQLRQAAEGMTAAVADDLNHFRAEFADVIGSLPATFAEIIPPILGASGELREGLSADMDTVRGKTGQLGQSYTLLGGVVRATHEEIAAGLKAADEAYAKAGFFIQKNFDVTRLRAQQTGGLLYASGGVVEPAYMAHGGPAGTDTVPAWLTPGEGVLNRTGMAVLDRLNSGMTPSGRGGLTIEKGAITIDARGAQFADERAMDVLADKLQQRLAVLSQRVGMN